MTIGSLLERKNVTPNILLVRVERPHSFVFNAGEHSMIRVPLPDGSMIERPFSFASSPETQDLEFIVQLKKNSPVPTFFNETALKTPIMLSAPRGGGLRPVRDKAAHFIAAGCGIAPFRSIIQERLGHDANAAVRLSFLREPEHWDVIDAELAESYRACNNFSYSIIHMRTEQAQERGWNWRHLDLGEPTLNEVTYVAGPPVFVHAIKQHLLERGFEDTHILTENG